MNCKKCGSLLNENDQFCKICGTSVHEAAVRQTVGGAQTTSSVSQPVVGDTPTTSSVSQPVVGGAQTTSSVSQPAVGGAQTTSSVSQPAVGGAQTTSSVSQPVVGGAPTTSSMSQPAVGGTQTTSSVSQPAVGGTPITSSMGQSINTQTPLNYSNQISKNSMVEQPQNSQPRQSLNNGYNGHPNYNPTPQKNNKNMIFIILGIVVVGVAVLATVLIISIFSKDKDSSNLSENNGNPTTINNKSSYKVSVNGFTFTIPDNFIYEEQNGVLLIGDETDTWVTQIEIAEGNFAQLKANKSQLPTIMQKTGLNSSVASEKKIGGVEYITLEVMSSGQKAIAALTKANSMYFIGITAMNQDNEFDYSILEKIAPIIKSVSYSGSKNNMKTNTKLDMNGLAALAK